MSDEGRLVAGRYRIIRRVGTGAMGAVWQAHDEVLHRTVAIKQLLLQPGLDEHEAEDARQRTMREGRIAARLHHPNAITVFDVVTDDNGQPCLIMEYLPSTSLAQELQKHKTLPPIEVARIGAQIASALKEAHAVGIVHRDIKPGNILLADNGVVKITDFGISRATDDVTVTKTGMIAGTPAYLAPEVAVGGDPGPESDVFSLGSTLYAASEGQPPFGLSENTLGLLHAVAAGQINPPRRSGPLTSVLAVMLHPDVNHRPTAQQCEELLAAVARGETPLGGPSNGADDGPDTTVLGAAGAAAGGALGGAAVADDSEGHTGRLDDGYGDYEDYEDYDDYDDYDGYPGDGYYDEGPASGRAHDTYDRYDQRPGPTTVAPPPTRAMPMGDAGHDRYDDRAYNDHDDRYDEAGYEDRDHKNRDDRSPSVSAAPDPEEKSNWKVPAIIGAVVVAGMAAFVMWVFGGSGGEDDTSEFPANQPGETTESQTSSTTTSETPTTTTTEEVVETTEFVPPNPNPGGPVVDDPLTTDPGSDSTTTEDTTTDSTTTTTDTTEEPTDTTDPDDPPPSTEKPTTEPGGGTS